VTENPGRPSVVSRSVRAISVFILLSACFTSCADYKELPGRPPVERIELIRNTATLSLTPGTDLGAVCDLSIFAGVTPRMRVEETQRLLRTASQRSTLFNSPSFVFEAPRGKIVLAQRRVDSEGSSLDKWELYAFPRDTAPQQLIKATVLRQLPNLAEVEEISIVATNDMGTAHISLVNGRVEWVYWGRDQEGFDPSHS